VRGQLRASGRASRVARVLGQRSPGEAVRCALVGGVIGIDVDALGGNLGDAAPGPKACAQAELKACLLRRMTET